MSTAQPSQSSNSFVIPISIILAGVLIAGAILASGGGALSEKRIAQDNVAGDPSNNSMNDGQAINPSDFRLPSKEDHVRGNPKAPVTIVEYSDFECPFCSRIHPTLERLVAESNDVKWVYRHLPLTSIHPRALAASVASECVADLSGNDAFWSFTDTLFENQRALSTELYEATASSLGVDLDKFRKCLDSQKIAQDVRDDMAEAERIGGRGTPFSVVVTASGELVPLSGALPYETFKAIVDQAVQS